MKPSDNETFVRFVQLALTDAETAAFVHKLDGAPLAERNALLTKTTAEMRARRVPEELVQVVEWLREPELVKKLLEVMEANGV